MIVNNGRLIVLEGSDGSGKATQSKLLLNALQKSGPVSLFEFPRYKKSIYGSLISKSLAGEYGDFLALSPYLSSLPYTIDRLRAKYLLLEALKEGDVICDRYTPSNLAFQGAKLPPSKRKDFIDFMEQGEYFELGLPAPDVVLYLWVPANVSRRLLQRRAGKERRKLDAYELRLDYQAKVTDMYLGLCRSHKNWHIVRCVDSKNKLLTRKAIHKKILQIIKHSKNKNTR